MHALQTRYGGASAVVVVFVALCAVVGWETGWGARVLPEPEAAPPPAPAPQPVPLSLLPDYQIEGGIASRRETVERLAEDFIEALRGILVESQMDLETPLEISVC